MCLRCLKLWVTLMRVGNAMATMATATATAAAAKADEVGQQAVGSSYLWLLVESAANIL